MGQNLTVAPLYEESGDITMRTEQVCPQCGENLVFTEDVIQLLVVQHHADHSAHPVQDDEDGDFLYEPYFLHFSCWEEIQDSLLEEVEDVPPVEDVHGPFRCKFCGSGIRTWEHCGSLTCGEFHISKRNPHGQRGEDFIEAAPPDVFCLYCLFVINEGIMEFYDCEAGGVSQFGECGDCLQARCWRLPAGTCPCTCHMEE